MEGDVCTTCTEGLDLVCFLGCKYNILLHITTVIQCSALQKFRSEHPVPLQRKQTEPLGCCQTLLHDATDIQLLLI